MRPDVTAQDIERVNDEIRRHGWRPHASSGETRTAGALGRDVTRLE
ncbi:hypothetical protein [Cystobacter fuscus]